MDTQHQIAILTQIIKGHKNRIRCVETDLQDVNSFNRRKERLESLIRKYQKELDALIHNHENGLDIIQDCYTRIADLNKKVRVLRRQKDVERLGDLLNKAQKLSDELAQ